MKNTKTRTSPNSSSLKNSFLFFISFLFCSSAFAQDQFVWTGSAFPDTRWTTASNWDYYPYGGSTHSTAMVYPGQVSPKNDIAMFVDNSAPSCFMDKDCSLSPTALRVGGIIVKSYDNTITQINSNRFNVSAVNDAGGDELPDFTVQIQSTDPTLISYGVVGMMAWQAYFQFAGTPLPSNGFQGNPAIPGPLDYTLLFAVPLRLVSGTFKAPKDEMWVRHDMFVNASAAGDFNNDHEGAVVLDNTNNGGGTRNYILGGVNFWNLRIGTGGAVGPGAIKEFSGGTCIVENDFTTGGLFGTPGVSASDAIIMNAPVGTEIHIKKDLIVGNKHVTVGSMVYAAADAYGDLFLVMNGDAPIQRIFHTESSENFSGCLPSLRINKPSGLVRLNGPTTVNNKLELVNGLVSPSGPLNNQGDLGISNSLFVINSNTIVSSNDVSYCTGSIRARTGKSLELPVGKGVYRPAVIRPVSGVGADNSQINLYTAEYFEASITASTPPSSFDSPTLDLITNCEMWAIDKADDTGSDPWTFHLALSYDPSSCSAGLIYSDTCKIAVTRWDQSEFKWKSHGNDAVFPTASNGDQTIRTSLAVIVPDFERSLPTSSTTPDLFTFGRLGESACITEPCAVNVCVDYCQIQDSFKFDPNIVYGAGSTPAGIFWDFGDGETSTEDHPVHGFAMDGVHMVTVTVLAVNDGDTCNTVYTFGIFSNTCTLPMMEMIQHNNNTISKDSKTVKTLPTENSDAKLTATPNPSSNGMVQFSLETTAKGNFDYVITNNLGQHILTGQIKSNEKMSINTSKLVAGSYIISVQLLDKKVTQQFMIVK